MKQLKVNFNVTIKDVCLLGSIYLMSIRLKILMHQDCLAQI